MRRSRTPHVLLLAPVAPLLFVVLATAAACSSAKSGANESDAGSPIEEAGTDDVHVDLPLEDTGTDAGEEASLANEVEPNNGDPISDIGSMALPGTMNGAINPANDVDFFAIQLAPGDFWEWKATPTSAELAPHVFVLDIAPDNLNPTVVAPGVAGSATTLQHFVLRNGTFVVGVADSRNTPTPSDLGGPGFGYALVAKRKTPTPIAVTFPTTKTSTLASLGSVDLYTFQGTGGKGYDIVIRAERKGAPSTLDSRLSLFDLSTKTAILTNDDASGTTDSELGSSSAGSSSYMVIVENEGNDASDLSYEIEFKLRP